MTWARLLAENKIKTHTTTLTEINSLRQVIDRDLADAALPGLSSDRSFATAYNAALQLATATVLCSGFRISSVPGHHKVAFDCVELAIGASVRPRMLYLDTCRRKRNLVDYDKAFVASQTEATELLKESKDFQQIVEEWIEANHPHLRR